MTYGEAILLAVVQGVFMFFPVSSTAHMTLLEHTLIARGSAMASPESPAMVFFKLLVHVGTVVSIVVVFWRDLGRLLGRAGREAASLLGAAGGGGGGVGEKGGRLHLRLIGLGLFSVFVTGAVGMPLRATGVFDAVFAEPVMVALTLALTGGLLYWSDLLGPRPRGLGQLTWLIALAIGLAQVLALAPGFSRSGLTIAAALLLGLKRRWAAEYSFFVAIPTILAATLVQGYLDLYRPGLLPEVAWGPYAVAFIVAALVGIAALYLVLVLLYRARLRYFAYYIWALAVVVVIAGISGDVGFVE